MLLQLMLMEETEVFQLLVMLVEMGVAGVIKGHNLDLINEN